MLGPLSYLIEQMLPVIIVNRFRSKDYYKVGLENLICDTY